MPLGKTSITSSICPVKFLVLLAPFVFSPLRQSVGLVLNVLVLARYSRGSSTMPIRSAGKWNSSFLRPWPFPKNHQLWHKTAYIRFATTHSHFYWHKSCLLLPRWKRCPKRRFSLWHISLHCATLLWGHGQVAFLDWTSLCWLTVMSPNFYHILLRHYKEKI